MDARIILCMITLRDGRRHKKRMTYGYMHAVVSQGVKLDECVKKYPNLPI